MPSHMNQVAPLTLNTSFTSSSQLSLSQHDTSSDTSLPRYRPDYSRSQHPQIPGGDQQRSNPAQPLHTVHMSPEQIRFEKYVNRFAAHDPRSLSPLTKRREQVDPEGLPPEKLSISERISRFNRLQSPVEAMSPARQSYTPAQQRDSFGSPPSIDRRISAGSERAAEQVPTPTSNMQQRHPSVRATLAEEHVTSVQQPKISASTSTSTTATNTTSTATERRSPTLERRDIASNHIRYPQGLSTPTRAPLMAEGRRSYSYDQPRSSMGAFAIETARSPARVADLRKKLWDNNETLQVAVPPSLHYVGPPIVTEEEKNPVATKAVIPKGPEMAGRFGQRSRSHSPKRPQYPNSTTFKSRYYEAARASRRTYVVNKDSPGAKPISVKEQQQVHDHSPTEAALKERDTARMATAAREESQHMIDHQRHRPQQGEVLRQEIQQQDYGPRKGFSVSDQEREAQRMQEKLLKRNSGAQRKPSDSQQTVGHKMPDSVTMPQDHHKRQRIPSNGVGSPDMWRSQPMPNLVDERSEGTGETSVAKLVARLNRISRDNPAEALAQIDSILRAESKSSSGDLEPAKTQLLPVSNVQEEKKDEYDGNDDEDSDDETSMSSITNPTYISTQVGAPNSHQSLPPNRNVRPSALQTYQQLVKTPEKEGQGARNHRKNKERAPPPATIQVKEANGRGTDQIMGRLDQHVVNSRSAEMNSAAVIAMKIRMWDEMSESKTSLRLDEALSIVPSLQEEIVSATTDELGSIVTPTDAPGGSVESSQRESPLVMSMLPTPPSTLLGPPSECSPDSSLDLRLPEPQIPLIELSDSQDRLHERGRQLSREDSPPPRDTTNSLTPRRRHPWDHHHPKKRSESRDSNSTPKGGSIEGLRGLEMRPIEPAPVTSPRNVLQIRREKVARAVSPVSVQDKPGFRGHSSKGNRETDSKSKGATSLVNAHGEASLKKEANNRREPATKAVATSGGDVSNPRSDTVAQPHITSAGVTGLGPHVFQGDSFEVDPKLLKSNDEFRFPIRIKQEELRPASFSTNYDPAWEPLAASSLFPSSKSASTKLSVAQERLVQRGLGSPAQTNVQDVGKAADVSQRQRQQASRTISPGRNRFSLLKLKRSHDTVVHSPPKTSREIDPLEYVDTASLESQRDDTVTLMVEAPKSPGRKFNLLKLKKSQDTNLKPAAPTLDMNPVIAVTTPSTQKRALSKSPSRWGSSPGPTRTSPARDRTGGFNIVQRFSRLRRERDADV